MSNREIDAQGFRLELRVTRDMRVPIVAGDHDLLYGWHNHPLEPDGSGGWSIFDSTHDRHTTWARRTRDHVVGAKFGGGKLRAVAWLLPR